VLEQIELRNFQKPQNLAHSFSPGLNLCFGPNWKGKSSFLGAIIYALFGSKALPIKQSNLVTFGQKSMQVSLTFSISDNRYRVVRGTSGARIYKSDSSEPFAAGHGPVTEEIERLVGPAKQFLSYQVALQGEGNALLLLGSAKLAQHIEQILGVDLIDLALERIKEERSDADYVKASISERDERLKSTKSDLAEAVSRKTVTAENLQQREQFISAKLSEKSALSKEIEDLRSSVDQRKSIESELSMLHSVEYLEQLIQEAESEQTTHITNEYLTNLYSEIQASQQNFSQRKHAADDVSHIKERISKLVVPVLPKEPDLTNLHHVVSLVRDLEGDIRLVTSKISEQEKALKTGICQACNRPFDNFNPEEINGSLAKLKEEVASLEQRKASAEREEQELLALKSQYEDASRAHDEAAKTKAKLSGDLQEAEAILARLPLVTVKSLQEAFDTYTEAHAQAQAAEAKKKELEALRANLEQTRAKRGALVSRLAQVPPVEGDQIEQRQVRLTELERSLSEHQQFAAMERGQLSELDPVITRLTSQETILVEEIKDLQARSARHLLLARLAKYLRANRESFSKHAWDRLLGLASRFAEGASGGAMTALQRDQDGGFVYVEGGEERPIEVASGHQKAIFGVALKVALAQTLGSPFQTLLLDEVSAAAEEENALRLTEQLASFGSQIVLVSHRESDTVLAQSVVSF